MKDILSGLILAGVCAATHAADPKGYLLPSK
jgi:hypothetical protein